MTMKSIICCSLNETFNLYVYVHFNYMLVFMEEFVTKFNLPATVKYSVSYF